MSFTARSVASGVAAMAAVGAAGTLFWTQREPTPEQQWALLDRYCVTCHNGVELAGDVAFDRMRIEGLHADAKVWETAIRKVRGHLMPPPGEPRPDAARLESFAGWLESALDAAALDDPNPGAPSLHRLNRAEYANAVRDLIDLPINGAALLPGDDSSGGFDNIANALSVSPALLQAYVSAAAKISRLAIGDPTVTSEIAAYRAPRALNQSGHVEGQPLGTRGGLTIEHVFPLDAKYEIRVGRAGSGFGLEAVGGDEDVEVTVNGERKALLGRGERSAVIDVPAGAQALGVAIVQKRDAEGVDDLFAVHAASVGIANVSIVGPLDATGPGDTPSRRKIFVCTPANAADEPACAANILKTLARRAYRRPVADDDASLATLMEFYEHGRALGTFDSGIQHALARVLVDPEFIFRFEKEPAGLAAGSSYRLGDFELASRLSFFLWSSIPDDELLAAAEAGELASPATLAREVRRMLADPKADALTRNFASQWLLLRQLDTVVPATNEFDGNLRKSFREETEQLFTSVLREDRSIVDLLDADYTFVDERLARHYGIPNIRGSRFRRVQLPAADLPGGARRGLLGQGSILTVTSAPNRTSPVKRGQWVLENILGSPVPPPPEGVDTNLDQTAPKAELKTMRERLERHQSDPGCSACHKLMDPIGFALENFDFIGKWRDADGAVPVDPHGEFIDGTALDGPAGLRRVLLERRELFVATASEKLMTYALGRTVEYYDMPAVRSIVRRAADDDYKLSALVLGIVQSVPFQMKAKAQLAADTGRTRAEGRGMFVTKKHLSRRALLRGAGAAIALPLLDSMIPARTALAQTAATPKSRLGCVYIPHGATMDKWTPAGEGAKFEFSEILQPLEPFRDRLCIVSGLAHKPVAPWTGEDTGGAENHVRAAAVFLSGAHPVKGDRAFVGPTVDQLAAAGIGQDTPLPSVELSIEELGLSCDAGFTCAYRNTLAWKSATLPLPMENNPQVVFERLFGDGSTDEQRQARRDQAKSLLDSVIGQVASLGKELPAADRSRMSDYLDEVREVERRVISVDQRLSSGIELPEAPTGVPDTFEEHLNLMFDLQVLAYKSEITRISTLMLARENSNAIYPGCGVREGFHNASHHSNERKNMDQFAVINRYHVKALTYFLDKLRSTPDGDGTLLDHSMILYGSSLSDGNEHNFDPLPVVLVGGASGQLRGGRHLKYAEHTPMSNLLLAMLHKLGVEADSIGDSTGPLEI